MGVVCVFGGQAVYIELDFIFGNEGSSKTFDYDVVVVGAGGAGVAAAAQAAQRGK